MVKKITFPGFAKLSDIPESFGHTVELKIPEYDSMSKVFLWELKGFQTAFYL